MDFYSSISEGDNKYAEGDGIEVNLLIIYMKPSSTYPGKS